MHEQQGGFGFFVLEGLTRILWLAQSVKAFGVVHVFIAETLNPK